MRNTSLCDGEEYPQRDETDDDRQGAEVAGQKLAEAAALRGRCNSGGGMRHWGFLN